MIAQVMVLRAVSAFFGSPPDIIYWMPDQMIKITAILPAKIKAEFTKLEKSTGIQPNVAACPTVLPLLVIFCKQLFQSIAII